MACAATQVRLRTNTESAKTCGYRSGCQVDAALRDFGIKHPSPGRSTMGVLLR